jgi:hypothetical protein
MAMFQLLQVVSVTLVAVGMTFALAHAAELPGKMRLSKETYLAVQPMYYPGFTIGAGFGEFGAMIAVLILLVLTPRGSEAFWWTLGAFLSLVTMHLIYWVVTHPVNSVWLKGKQMKGFGSTFFSIGVNKDKQEPDWTKLRDTWEYSHVARAVFALLSLVLLTIAVTV